MGGGAPSRPGQAKPGVRALGRRLVPSVLCSICLSTGAHPAFHSIGLAALLPAWLLKYVWGRRVAEKTAPGINNPAQSPETRTLRTPGRTCKSHPSHFQMACVWPQEA